MIMAQKQFAVSKFGTISQAGTRIGLAQYSSNVYPYWGLAETQNAVQVGMAFDGLYWRAGSTSTGEAIAYGQNQLLSGPGARADAHKLMVLVTDGEPSNKDLALLEANKTITNGTYLFIMGYGPEVNQDSSKALLQQMVANPKDLLTVNNVSEYSSQAYLDRLERDYIDHLCFRPPPTVAPTAAPTAVPTVAPTPDPRHKCLNKSIDFYFLLDTSTSIESSPDLSLFTDPNVSRGHYNGTYTTLPGYTGPTPNYDNVISVLKNFTGKMNVGGDLPTVKVGMAQWSNYPIPEWGLTNYSAPGQKSDLLGAFDRLKWRGGSTYADRAIEYGVNELKREGAAITQGHYQVLVLVTDGVASHITKAKAAALKARNDGMLIYVLGYGAELAGGLMKEQMIELTGSTNVTERFFHVTESKDLMSAVDKAIETMCFDLTLPPTKVPTKAPTATPTMPVSCTNGVEDGTESDVDCGGLMCQKCTAGQKCEGASDCESNACEIRMDTLQRVCPSTAPTPSPTSVPSNAPTPAPTVYPTRDCYNKKIDWYFVLDSSSSIESTYVQSQFDKHNVTKNLAGTVDPGYSGTAPNYKNVVGQLKQLTSEMAIGTDGVNVGMVQFGSQPIPEWSLSAYNSSDKKRDLLDAFDQLLWRGGSTYTHTAIDFASTQLTGAQSRPGALKVIYIVTDGKASDFNQTIEATYKARAAGIVVYIVGYGAAVMTEEARVHFEEYLGSTDQYSRVASALDIKKAIDNSTTYMCSFLTQAPTASPTPAPTTAPTFLIDCTNGVKNDKETDVDCGGVCTECAYGKSCEQNQDCLSGMCSPSTSTCLSAAPTPSPTMAPTDILSASPTLVPTMYPTWQCPSVGKIDWFYLLDSSSSIEKDHLDNGRIVCSAENPLFTVDGYNGNTTNFAGVVASLKQQASYLKIGPDDIKVGLAQFSTEPVPEWDMQNFSSADSKPALLAAFDKLRYRCGGTVTNDAIKYGQAQLTSGIGRRVDASKVLCVVTDGVANNNEAAQLQASYAKGNGTIIYVIGYGDEVYRNEAANQALRQMATSNDFYFSAKDASGIQAALDNATNHFCMKAFSAAPSARPSMAPTNAPSFPTSCSNTKRDGTETDVDCGGPFCGKCAGGKVCDTNADCTTDLCTNQRCVQPPSAAPTSMPTTEIQFKCSNGDHNGDTESDVDCGGLCTQKCALGKNCETAGDCESGYCDFQTQRCSVATPAPTPALVGYVTTTTVSIGGFTQATFEVAKPSFMMAIATLYGIEESNIVNLEVSNTPFTTRRLLTKATRALVGEKIYVRFDILSTTASGANGAEAVAAVSDRVFTDVDAFDKTFTQTMTTNKVVPPEGLTSAKESVSKVQFTAAPTMQPTVSTTLAPVPVDKRSIWEKEKWWLMPTILVFSGLVVVLLLATLLCRGKKPREPKSTKLESEVKSRMPVKGPQLVDALGKADPDSYYGNYPSNSVSNPYISPNGSQGVGSQYTPGGQQQQQQDPYRYYSNAQRSTPSRSNGGAIGNGGMSPGELQSQLSKIEDEIRMLNQQEQVQQITSKDRAMSPVRNSPDRENEQNQSMRTPFYENSFSRSPQQQWQPRSEPPSRRPTQRLMQPGDNSSGGNRQVGQHWQQQQQQQGGYSLNGINSQDV
jgi:hypothetical protein